MKKGKGDVYLKKEKAKDTKKGKNYGYFEKAKRGKVKK